VVRVFMETLDIAPRDDHDHPANGRSDSDELNISEEIRRILETG
jgi:hypothetical protein